MKQAFYFWVESYLFGPNLSQKLLSWLFLPVSLLYCLIVSVRRAVSHAEDFGIPIISVGNLIVGGSGKTPFTIALAREFLGATIILRGYGRASSGLVVVSQNGVIMSQVERCGDEAMLLAHALPKASVIVCEDRKEAILKAKAGGAKLIFLDDGFSKSNIKKFDILIRPAMAMPNRFCLPSGAYRERPSLYDKADLVVVEGRDYTREVTIKNPTDRMVLVTAISKPQRLDRYVPNHIEKIYYPDHHFFNDYELEAILRRYNADSILTTQKDAVKINTARIDLSILELSLTLRPHILERINKYIADLGKIT